MIKPGVNDKEMDLPSRYWIPKITQVSLIILLGLPIVSQNLIPNYYHPLSSVWNVNYTQD
jgi:hypothetical protein